MLNTALINLKTLTENAETVKSKLNKGVKMCAVVKANAYGHGAPHIAAALYKVADCFAVALLEEGVELRLSGIDKQILCLIPFSDGELNSAVFYDLTATVTEKSQVKKLNAAAKAQNKKVKVHIKFNTGMNRQGVDGIKALNELIREILKSEFLILDGLYSHLACPKNKKKLNMQLNKFLLANNLIKSYNNNVTCHISASGGFLMGAQFDMVRIGLLLYGYKPFKSDLVSVSPVMKVYSNVISTRTIKKGQSALYGVCKADSDVNLALVRYGYADGLFRKQSCGQFNNRCMDLTYLLGEYKKGELVPIMTDADLLAKKYSTISYEVLTKSALRAEKIYTFD